MRITFRVVAMVVCFGVLSFLYFFVGNAADEPPLTERGLGKVVSVKVAKQVHEEPQKKVGASRKEAKAAGGGDDVSARLRQKSEWRHSGSKFSQSDEIMHLAVVVCGNRMEEMLIMMKSALLFSIKKIKFYIFADDVLNKQIKKALSKWPQSVSSKFQYTLYPIIFPVGNVEEWKRLFRPCAAQRLFLPEILKDVDSLLYVDIDVLFLRPMDDIWKLLKAFNSTQLAAMAPEHEIPSIDWYSRFARHPFYGVSGINSGVLLMNLTRFRSTLFKNTLIPGGMSWKDMIQPLYQKYKNHIAWGDQDILNIVFHYNPEYLYILPCQWNYMSDHCSYGSNCKGAEEEGVSILHGNREAFGTHAQTAFKVMYDAIHNYTFGENMFQSLFYPLQTKFLDTVNTMCGRIPHVFLRQIEKSMRDEFEKKVVRHARPPHRQHR